MKKFAALLALAISAGAQPAMAQDLSEEEASAVSRFALPSAFGALQQRCTGALPADAYMLAEGDALMARLQAVSEGSWSAARNAAIRLASGGNAQMGEVLAGMPRSALEPFVDELVAGLVASEIETGNCPRIDRVLELLDPLPAENLADLLGYIAVEARKEEAQAGG